MCNATDRRDVMIIGAERGTVDERGAGGEGTRGREARTRGSAERQTHAKMQRSATMIGSRGPIEVEEGRSLL